MKLNVNVPEGIDYTVKIYWPGGDTITVEDDEYTFTWGGDCYVRLMIAGKKEFVEFIVSVR